MDQRGFESIDLLASPTGTWSPVSPRLARVRRLLLVVWGGLAAVVWGLLTIGLGATIASVLAVIGAIGLAVIILAGALGMLFIGRVVKAWGYAMSDDMLYIRRGRLFHRMTAVPYARLQFVDVTAGPLDRRFGLASVKLHTASASTDAHIPGLPVDIARELRDTLTTLSEGRYAGL